MCIYWFCLKTSKPRYARGTTVFPGFAGTFSFGARLTPLNLALLEKREKQRFNEFCHSPFFISSQFLLLSIGHTCTSCR